MFQTDWPGPILIYFYPKIGAMGVQLRNVLRAVGAFLMSIAVIVLIDFTLQVRDYIPENRAAADFHA